MKPLRWRFTFIALLTIWAAYVCPTIIYFMQPKEVRNDEVEFSKAVPSWLPEKHAKLGLDLQVEFSLC